MGFRNAEELIAGLFATALAPNQRIEITSTDANTISFYSGDPKEGAPAVIRVESLDLFNAFSLALLSARAAGAPDAPRAQVAVRTDRDTGGSTIVLDASLLQILAPTVTAPGVLQVPTITTGSGDLALQPASGLITVPAGTHIKREAPQTPTLLNGWVPFGGTYQAPRYFRLPDGTGHLAGVISGSGAGGGIMQLPSGYWPVADVTCDAPCNAGKHAQIVVAHDGLVFLQNVDTGVTWVSLQGCWWHIAGF